jgi:hypothetical protein
MRVSRGAFEMVLFMVVGLRGWAAGTDGDDNWSL